MKTAARKKDSERMELRVSTKDKELFEYASSLKGFKSFSEFARLAIYKEAKAIIEEEKIYRIHNDPSRTNFCL